MPFAANAARAFAACAALLCLCAACAAAELTGVVKSASGRPVAGVVVSSPPNMYAGRETSSDGYFRIKVVENIVLFWHPDYRPLTKILKGGEETLEVTLEDAAPTRWEIPPCKNESADGRTGFRFMLRVPKGAEVTGHTDIDYQYFAVAYGSGAARRWLQGIEGPNATLGYPDFRDVLSSAEFTERSWRSGDIDGIDMRGRSREGYYWRQVGLAGSAVYYRGASADASAFFDKLIATACFGR